MGNFFFDYFFYRITKLYFRWDKETGSRAIIAIAMIQAMTICNGILLVARLFWEKSEITPYSKILGILSVIILLFFIVYNSIKYRDKYELLKLEWQDESRDLRIKKGILILFFLILPWAVLFIMIAE